MVSLMMSTIVVILCLFSIITSILTIPDCQEGRISFTSELSNAEVVCGRDNNATFLCQFQGSVSRPRWIINSTEYSSINSELPPDHYYSSHSLTVTNINDKNGTRYQCQLLVFEDGELCAYKSTIGQLIYRCPRGAFNLQSAPYYSLNSTELNRIQTTVSQLSSPADFYSITYSDYTHGEMCYNATIPASSCVNGTCIHVFDIKQSLCDYNTSIIVAASSNTHSLLDFEAPNKTKIDAFNKFVQVTINMSPEVITVNCTFLNQPVDTNYKTCGVVYGPDCKDLSSDSGSVITDTSNCNSIVFNMVNEVTNSINNVTCFLVTASNTTKTVKVEGSLYERKSDGIHLTHCNLLLTLIILTAINLQNH